MRILAEGGGVVVHDGGNAWSPESGQLHIDFIGAGVVSPGARPAKALPSATLPARNEADPWELFDLALELEATDPAAALLAYGRALTADPTLTDAHVNIGRLLQLAGRTREAVQHYLTSIRSATTDPTAAFNLGTALEELGRWRDALAAYQRAVETDGRFADAHFNLARLHDQLGHRAEAIRHLRAYKRLVE